MPFVRKLALLAMLCAAGPGMADDQGAQPLSVRPFVAVYELEWHGLGAGESTVTLAEPSPGTYEYSSVNRARGIFRLAFPHGVSEKSRFTVVGGHVQPLAYQEDNGKASQNISLQFDWAAGRAHGTAGDKAVDQPLQPGTQDPLSVQIELIRDLIAGDPPTHFLLFDHDSANEYQYTRERTETLDTALGRLDTVIYRSDRPDSDRVMRLWLAPSLGYMPVQAIRWRKGKIEFQLHIRELKQEGQPPAATATQIPAS